MQPATRRLFAMILLATTTSLTVEAVVGALRDADVHHESPLAAANHQIPAAAGEHGHEHDAPVSQPHEHSSEHEHGTSTDHCTHLHGIALPAGISIDFVLVEANAMSDDLASDSSWVRSLQSPPPKA